MIRTPSSSRFYGLVLVSALLIAAAAAATTTAPPMVTTAPVAPGSTFPTTATLGSYQSWACKSPAADVGSLVQMPMMPISINNNTKPETVLPAAVAGTAGYTFLYNVAYGPPNQNLLVSGNLASWDLFLLLNPVPSGSAISWGANMNGAASQTANGFPYGCCAGMGGLVQNGVAGQVTVAELGCKFCLNPTTGSLPMINPSASAYDMATNQQVTCPSCSTSTLPGDYQPTSVGFSAAGGVGTDVIATGQGVLTLQFPPTSSSVLAAGIYQFQLWAESICGVAMSQTVTLAVRCPPSPVVEALLRAVPGTPGTNSAPLSNNADGSYTVVVGTQALVDASCSYPYQMAKPGLWPAAQAGVTAITQPDATFNPTRNLYAIQSVYFSVADNVATSLFDMNGNAMANPVVHGTGAYSQGQIANQWAAIAQFNTGGTHTVIITVTDGCSAAQATIKVTTQCSCPPVAKALYVPTLWTNVYTPVGVGFTAAPSGGATMNNDNVLQGTLTANNLNPVQPTDVVNGLPLAGPGNLISWNLQAQAHDFEGSALNLAYDWNFVYWIPDFSGMFLNKAAAASPKSIQAEFFPSNAAPFAFPPSSTATCSAASGNGDIPAGWCASGANCCFSSNDITTNIGTLARPTAANTYLYKVLYVTNMPAVMGGTIPNTLRMYTTAMNAGIRIKMYNFMRISSGCSVTVTGANAWSSNMTATTMTPSAPFYSALPMYLNYNPTNQPANDVVYNDFNGFPNVNGAATTATINVFRPTTECGAWLKGYTQATNYMQVQTLWNQTVSCGMNTDLVLCRVSITTGTGAVAGSFNTPSSVLQVSSFGACKGVWQFSLSVDDSCGMTSDYFNLNVGCNRAPSVSAGCTNSQTWTSSGFEQISLDGRATFDPDNFGDLFYNLPARGDTFPGCDASNGLCSNGGLGMFGLTYAWALLSFSNGVAVQYPSSSPTALPGANCPIPLASLTAACDDGCAGATAVTYPWVDSQTRMYDTTKFVTGTAFSPSVQGGLTLIDAWQHGLYAVQSVTMSALNTMPVFEPTGSSLTMAPVFPDFTSNCAPTVYPMLLGTTLTAGGPNGNSFFGTTTPDWSYAQQIKRVGNSAYIKGLTQAGTYVARLYAFDGCSVSSADVTFVLDCPTLIIPTSASFFNVTTSGFATNAGGAGTAASPYLISTGTAYTNIISDFHVVYSGSPSITPTGIITLYFADAAGNANFSRPVVPPQGVTGGVQSCSFGSKITGDARTMAIYETSACNGLIYTANAFNPYLQVGNNYVMVATVSDGCVRPPSVPTTITSPVFKLTCLSVILQPGQILASTTGYTRLLTYTQPSGGGSTAGSFPSFSFNVTAFIPGSTPANPGKINLYWTAYWRPVPGTVPATDQFGGGSSTTYSTFLGTSGPLSGVYPVYRGSVTNVDAGGVITSGGGYMTVPGGTKPIAFPQTSAVPLSGQTTTAFGAVNGLRYNTATSAGQVNFIGGDRANTGIYWAGDYYVNVYANLATGGCDSGPTTTATIADQFFRVVCPAASVATPAPVDPSINAVLWANTAPTTGDTWVDGNGNIFTGQNYYFGSAFWTGTAFRSTQIQLVNAATAGAYVNGAASSISYRLSYRAAATVAPNPATGPATASSSTPFAVFFQNPLLLSPFSMQNVQTGMFSTAVGTNGMITGNPTVGLANTGNAAQQVIQTTFPGTWSLDTFNTDGCQNITGSKQIDISNYCYDSNMPEATTVFTVLSKLPPAGCVTAGPTDAGGSDPQCDVSATNVFACTFTAVRGPMIRVGAGALSYARRRLVEPSADTQAKPHSAASRKLLQTALNSMGTTFCQNVNTGLGASTIGSTVTFTNPGNNAQPIGIPASYPMSTTPTLSPNYGAFVSLFFNSFDVVPDVPVGDVRNFYGMADLFGDGKITMNSQTAPLTPTGNGVMLNPATYQGAFEALTIKVDPSTSTLRTPPNAAINNQFIIYLQMSKWNSMFTSVAGMQPATPWWSAPAPANFPAAYSAACSWAPIPPTGGMIVNFPPYAGSNAGAYNAYYDLPMALQGCNPLGGGTMPLTSSNIAASTTGTAIPAVVKAGINNNNLIVSSRPVKNAANAFEAGSDLFNPTMVSMATAVVGRTTTRGGAYDFVAMAWNGAVGSSCYDYRAVRVMAICNRLVPYDSWATPTSTPSFRGSATEGPMLAVYAASVGTVTKAAAAVSQTVNWMTGQFDGAVVSAGFKYLQCGSGTALATTPGGTDPQTNYCGMQPGSSTGEGNYYSLQYSWSVQAAPLVSMYNVAPTNLTTFTNFGNAVATSITTTTMNGLTTTMTNYTRTNLWTVVTTNRQIKLLNHGYKYPMTTFRPDFSGMYNLMLTIADGCSTWQSPMITVNAVCPTITLNPNTFATAVTVMSSYGRTMVSAAAGSSTPAPTVAPTTITATATPFAVPANNAPTSTALPTYYTVAVDGTKFSRITMTLNGFPAAAAGSYSLTYNWVVTSLSTPGTPNKVMQATNMQGTSASFVPFDLSNNMPASVTTQVYRVDLWVNTNCPSSDTGLPVTMVYSAYIQVTCNALNILPSNFIFYQPYVNTYSTSTNLFWGYATGTAGLPQFFTSKNGNPSLYYRNNMAVAVQKPSGSLPAGVTMTSGAIMSTAGPIVCDTAGPYCSPTVGASGSVMNVPTILFGGSVPQGTGANGQPANSNIYANINGVWGAGWQQLYFSVPVSLSANSCKIKAAYWVLTNYMNSLPFTPTYVASQSTPAPVGPTCQPTQVWSWTVTQTPCTTCSCGATDGSCLDNCDFPNNNQYMAQANTISATGSTVLSTGYMPPNFYQIGTLSSGTSVHPYCIFDSGNRMNGANNIVNQRTNCRVSGRGLSVTVTNAASGGACSASGQTGVDGSASQMCPMGNVAFVPAFPGTYQLTLTVYDGCGSPQTQPVTVVAQCRTKPTIATTQSSITTFYDCADGNNNNAWGTSSSTQSGAGKFGQVTLSSFVTPTQVTNVADTTPASNTPTATCSVAQVKTSMNCTDVKNWVNSQNVMVDTGDNMSTNKFKACCTCMYGTQTFNVFGGTNTNSNPSTTSNPNNPFSTAPNNGSPSPTNNSPAPPIIPGSTTQHNILALDDGEFNRNSVLLIALVTPMAVVLVGSLAGNVLMVLKMKQGASLGGGYNVRAGDVELSTSPRARVDV